MAARKRRAFTASEPVERRARELERAMKVESPDGRRSLALALATAESAIATLDRQRDTTGALDGDRARALGTLVRSVGRLASQAGLDVLPRRRSRAAERAAELRALPPIVPARPARKVRFAEPAITEPNPTEPIAASSSHEPTAAPPPAAPVVSLEDLIRAPGRTG